MKKFARIITISHMCTNPPNDLENQNFESKKKKCLEILSFHTYICSINEDHMMYGSWDMVRDRQNFLSSWTIFCHFTPLWTPKINMLKKWKKKKSPGDYYHFTNVHHKWQSYDVWFLRYGVQRTEFLVILDCFLPFYPPNNPKNQNFEKMKKSLGILSFYTYVP